jgi:alkylated DNA repair protein (DNA oxidative demethylase)
MQGNLGLFEADSNPTIQKLAKGALLLRGFALAQATQLMADLESIIAAAPLRHMVTPGGFTMSVAMTNCGAAGWISDRKGYRYAAQDPLKNQAWPPMPASFSQLAGAAAAQAGYPQFDPDACLINRYEPGARMTLHQDKNELDFSAPIVSVSLGLPAVFLFGGPERKDKAQRIPLNNGDVVVWGGPSRLFFHGINPLKDGDHPLTGRCRYNLTFRLALLLSSKHE